MDTDLLKDAKDLLDAPVYILDHQIQTIRGAVHNVISYLESQAAPQETTTETRWERGTTLPDAPACEHNPEPFSTRYELPENVYEATCKHCKQTIRAVWVPAGSA